MTARYFFHLTDERLILRDAVGIEASDVREIETAAIDIIREFRIEEAGREHELRNWRLLVTDGDGRLIILLAIFAGAKLSTTYF